MTEPLRPLYQALAVAARGWPVFPCSPNDKRPFTEHGFEDASTDPDQIRRWWTKWPKAMVAVPTGTPIGAFVVDLDPKGEATAEGLLGVIESTIGEILPPGPRVRTPRGGLHLYFSLDPELAIGNRANMVPDVDVRGTGGYVIVPDSVRSGARAVKDGCDGKAYEWDPSPDAVALPAPPARLVDLVLKRGEVAEALPRSTTIRLPKTPSGDKPPAQSADERQRKYALSAFDLEVRAVSRCGKGGRNHQLNQSAFALGQLVGAGLLTESVVAAALEGAAADCGLVKDDGIRSVRKTIESGLAGGIAQPRDLSDVGRRGQGASLRPPPPDPLDYGDANPRWSTSETSDVDASSPAPPSGPESHGSRGAKDTDSTAGGGGRGGAGGPPGSGSGPPAADDDVPSPEAVLACAAEPLNDTGNARRLMAHFGADMLNVREVGPHAWAGTHWEPEGGQEAFQRFAQRTAERVALEATVLAPGRLDARLIEDAERLASIAAEDLQPEERRIIADAAKAEDKLAKRRAERRKWAVSCGNSSRIAGMINQALPHITVPPDALDAEPLAVNVRNGTLRLVEEPDPEDPDEGGTRTRWAVRLHDHDRDDRIAKLMPVEFDPEARAPAFEKFLDRFQPKPPIRRFLQQFYGYALTGLMGEQIFVFHYGLGANGKSTFMEAVARLMGNYAQLLPAEALTGDSQRRSDQATPEFARLPGARLVRCAELPRGERLRENTLKLLTGGEPILVRHLHKGFFDLKPIFKATGSGNDKPQVVGVDEGIWRRMRLVPWEVMIPLAERRPMERVLAEFAAESAGILNWLLDGLCDYLTHGLIVPPEIAAATESYRADMDPVGEFTAACVRPAPDRKTTAREMYLAYVAWCHANSVKPFAEKTFAATMTTKGFAKSSGRIREYIGVVLEGVPDDPEASGRDAGSSSRGDPLWG